MNFLCPDCGYQHGPGKHEAESIDLKRRLSTVLEAAERLRDDIKERRVDPYDFGWGGSRNADGSIAYVTVVDDDDPLVAALEQAIKEARGGAFVDSA